MSGIVIAIDGPAGAGKSTVSRRLAQVLGYRYIDTGAMYRVIGVLAAAAGLSDSDHAALAALCDRTAIETVERDGSVRVLADGRDVTEAIRTPAAAQWASRCSAVPAVRERLVAKQRRLGSGGGVVMEGRDIGTVVFPDAAVKIYLDASPHERAQRRAAEPGGGATAADIERMARDLTERDTRDRGRAHSPLRAASDAVVIDTTHQSVEAVVRSLHALVTARLMALASQC